MIKRYLFISFLLYSATACNPHQESVEVNQKPYFDVAEFFKKEATRLQKKQQRVQKKVGKNGQQEIKQLQIQDWEREFGLFISSDINKADWLGSYTIDSTAQKISYTRKEAKLRTESIEIYKLPSGRVKQIQIINSDKNWLYSSNEKLNYFPDSLYRIHKEQSILILGESRYTIEGVFNK